MGAPGGGGRAGGPRLGGPGWGGQAGGPEPPQVRPPSSLLLQQDRDVDVPADGLPVEAAAEQVAGGVVLAPGGAAHHAPVALTSDTGGRGDTRPGTYDTVLAPTAHGRYNVSYLLP